MVKFPDITITSLDIITAFAMNGDPRFVMDELQNTTIGQTEDTEDMTGKKGRLLNRLKKNKAVSISGTNGMLSGGLMETQAGSQFEHKESAPIMWTDYLTVTGNAATTEFKAVGTTGAEIMAVYIRDANGAAGDKLTQAATVGEKQFTYTPATKALAFNEGEIEDGSEIVVFYMRNVEADVLVNKSDAYTEKLRLYVDATAEDRCSNVYHVQFYIPKADFSGQFEIAMGDSQTVHAFEATSLAGSCGGAGQFWTYTVFGANAEDAA